jgi:hypothetical protein
MPRGSLCVPRRRNWRGERSPLPFAENRSLGRIKSVIQLQCVGLCTSYSIDRRYGVEFSETGMEYGVLGHIHSFIHSFIHIYHIISSISIHHNAIARAKKVSIHVVHHLSRRANAQSTQTIADRFNPSSSSPPPYLLWSASDDPEKGTNLHRLSRSLPIPRDAAEKRLSRRKVPRVLIRTDRIYISWACEGWNRLS